MEPISSGSFGVVFKVDTRGTTFAAKIMRDPGTTGADILREKVILHSLRESPNRHLFIYLHDDFFSGSSYIQVYEYMKMDLRMYLGQYGLISMTNAKKILRQLLQALCHLGKFLIIHADIKPDNLVIDDRTLSLKVIDFGQSHFTFETKNHTQIATQCYRAPEVMLGAPYGLPIDMWAFGCVAGEMLAHRILYPGADNSEMMAMFQKSHGLWNTDWFQTSRAIEQVIPLNQLAECIPCHYFTCGEMMERFLLNDVVEGCLAFHPDSRMKPETALEASFFKVD